MKRWNILALVAASLLLIGVCQAGPSEDRAADVCQWLDSNKRDVGELGFCGGFRTLSPSKIDERVEELLQELAKRYGAEQRVALESEVQRMAEDRAANLVATRARLLANIRDATDAQLCELILAADSPRIAETEALRRKL